MVSHSNLGHSINLWPISPHQTSQHQICHPPVRIRSVVHQSGSDLSISQDQICRPPVRIRPVVHQSGSDLSTSQDQTRRPPVRIRPCVHQSGSNLSSISQHQTCGPTVLSVTIRTVAQQSSSDLWPNSPVSHHQT